MVKALATFIRLVSKVFAGLENILEAFGIYSNTIEEHLEHLKIVF